MCFMGYGVVGYKKKRMELEGIFLFYNNMNRVVFVFIMGLSIVF